MGWNFKFSELGCIFHINNKELIAAIIALELSRLSGAACSFLCVDNTAVVSWLKKRCDVGNVWHSFILECWIYWWKIHSFDYSVVWVSSELNLADKWTRW